MVSRLMPALAYSAFAASALVGEPDLADIVVEALCCVLRCLCSRLGRHWGPTGRALCQNSSTWRRACMKASLQD